VGLTTIADLVFAGGVVVAALSLASAALRRGPSPLLASFAVVEAVAAVSIWIAFALRHERPLAVAAGGLTGCLLAAAGALLLRSALRRVADIDGRLAEAQTDLLGLVEHERSARAAELELTLARARADSRSLLDEQERQLAEERRALAEEREHETMASLAGKLTEVQGQVEQRLAAFSEELDRAVEATGRRIAELEQRRGQLLGDLEARIAADADRLAAESEERRAALTRLRSELERTLEETLSLAQSELEAHTAERRRGLHELEERLSRRERELTEQAQREEVEAVQRIRVGFEDVARRQVEHLERNVERSIGPHVDEAAQRFSQLVKTAREDAAKRLGRELDRAVSTFAREAETVLAERLAHVGDAGAQRLERRIAEVGGQLERRHDELVAAQEQRHADLEGDVRRRMDELHADLEAERGVLEARLQELMRRFASATADS
jgi:hypothetical protein